MIKSFAGATVGLYQLIQLKRGKRIDFTYKVYMDLFNFLNDSRNQDIKDWLLEKDNYQPIPPDQYFRLDDLFEKFEVKNFSYHY